MSMSKTNKKTNNEVAPEVNTDTDGKVSLSDLRMEAQLRAEAEARAEFNRAFVSAYQALLPDARDLGAKAGKRRATKMLGQEIPRDGKEFLAWLAKTDAEDAPKTTH